MSFPLIIGIAASVAGLGGAALGVVIDKARQRRDSRRAAAREYRQ